MNERYLFRGKRMDNGEWATGYYVRAELPDNSGYEHLIIEQSADGGLRKVIPETVTRCTWLKDKNGKLIFDGDIVKAYKHNETPYTEAVTFRDGCFWFGSWNWVEFLNVFRNIEVIGNIHDNKDLLEVQNG